ncbi:hypothetical protein QAD02_014191 [Eretmocerus hayati]|uniref:Uncharacterized protein n=1 Tax=Eretmocerus hayati TaxID=131215 RepID=A0ACC2P512_9HYME|nr:hypothetical protein QAD02_014191 [Eretmocerus hayati]
MDTSRYPRMMYERLQLQIHSNSANFKRNWVAQLKKISETIDHSYLFEHEDPEMIRIAIPVIEAAIKNSSFAIDVERAKQSSYNTFYKEINGKNMYDQIFDDLERVRRNCETFGDLPFEENAVFDLLENLHPRYGSERSIEIVMGMLEDQKFHDIGGYLNQKDQSSEISNDAKSNDGDSIVEVEVPKKIHPFIDLTNNSPESDGSVVIEKSIVEKIEKDEGSESNSSEAEVYLSGGDNDFLDLSDSEPFKNLTDDWNMSSGGLRKSGCAPPLIDFLSLLKEPVKTTTNLLEGDSSISSPAGASEILEENNNDPNNNLDSIILDGESGNANNTSHPNLFSHDSGNECLGFLENDGLAQDVLDPSPGCSKYTDTKVNFPVHKNLPHTKVRPPPSPVPGCSKDFESKDDPKQEHEIDKLIKNDADCIKEIMPWADSHTIHCLLDKYRSSSNRKQLALWDLMSQDANQNGNAASKRKFIFDSCEVQTKVSKSERHDNLENHSIETNPGSFHEQKNHQPIPVNSFSDDESMNADISVINHRDLIFGEDTATESSKPELPRKKGVYPSNGSLVCSVPLMNQDHTLGRLLDDSCNTIESDQESVGRNNNCTINSNNVGASVSLGSAIDHDLLSKDNDVGRLIEKTCDEIVTIQQQLKSDAELFLMRHKNIPISGTISPKKEGDLRHNKSAVLQCSTVSHESNAVPMTSVITDAASSKFPFAKGGKSRTPNQVTETTFSANRPSQVTRIRSAPAVDAGVYAKSELWPKSAASNYAHIKTAEMKLSMQHPSFVSKSNAHRVQPSATVTSSALNVAKRGPPATITSNSNFRYRAGKDKIIIYSILIVEPPESFLYPQLLHHC